MAIINGRGTVGIRRGTVIGPSTPPILTPLLDSYSGASASYSLRKLRTAYSGSVIRVRRGSDNQELNIGFDASGNLDTSALSSFVGANNGFVTVWYDQSGNGKNASQSTTTYQPLIVSGGTILTTNGKPSIQFDGIDDFLYCGLINNGTKPSDFSTLIVSKFNSLSTTQSIIASIDNGASNINSYNYFTNRNSFPGKLETSIGDGVNLRVIRTSETFINNIQYLFEYFYSSNVSPYTGSILWNGSIKTPNIIAGTSTSNAGTEFKTSIGRMGEFNGFYLNGRVQEIVTYFSNKISDRTSIESNINSYYSIY